MIVYRVETSFCLQDYFDEFNRNPASPYGNSGSPSIEAIIWLQENGVNFSRFSHHCDNTEFNASNVPGPSKDQKLVNSLLKYHGALHWEYMDNPLEEFIFGFSDVDSCKRWFIASEREELNDSGFYLAMYEIDKKFVCEGDFQTVFIREKSELVGFLEIDKI
jgi:hypothetical protein